MDWLVGYVLLIIPPWLQSIGTAAIGALLAYAIWSWLHSPYLYPGDVIHQTVVEVDQEDNQRSIRIPIKNVGTRAAKNCDTVFRVRVKISGDAIRSFHPVPWLPLQANLVVDDSEHTTRVTIPAGRSSTIELIRQYRNGNTQIYPHTGGEKFIRTSPGEEYHREAEEAVDYAVLSPRGSRASDAIQTTGVLSKTDVSAGEWDNAVVELTVETESARPLTVRFDAYANDDGVLRLERKPLSWQRQAVGWLYRVVNRLRRLGTS